MAELEVLYPGLYSSIQDLGRFGFQKYGVPQSGAMDKYAFKICNLVLGNQPDDAVMEITMQGPQLKFNAPAHICISGADISPTVNGHSIENDEIVTISSGDILKFGKLKIGFRAYIGIKGGFRTSEVLQSKSWYDGITEKTRLEKGMKIAYDDSVGDWSDTFSSIKTREKYYNEEIIEVYPGPEFDKITESDKKVLFQTYYSLDENSNRMAIQLNELFENELEPIITGPVVPGTIQLTPSGKLIILMRDCQTTGGYPRILQLPESSMNVLSQKLPGDQIKFRVKNYS